MTPTAVFYGNNVYFGPQADIQIHAAYGSSKDISVYNSVGLQPPQIFIIGKVSKKQYKEANVSTNSYYFDVITQVLSQNFGMCGWKLHYWSYFITDGFPAAICR